ncbi:hypothetical protein HL667_26310 [Bradyrhizobium sp. 83012]|uniref:Large exoprotein involved in heme utilization or adhesion n=1 Tax=Bradyrhizobium aeschynomenes TaxID=2734909 RepID=A0ABX2CJZ7_9BRAD|nr:hypothetical protein [Bradyrhizobium aeschynomenes]NPU11788.1 hypothetical protein [Bradyrhizobium aeschynomenes]NPU68539.1 hypothetical protein [Bradyrhizobium aeschynomenes]
MVRIVRFTAAAVLAAAAIVPSAPARAAGFDGPWTVLIITEAGSCDQGYSFPVQISGGRVTSAGSANITGTVGRGGAVTVRVSQGGSSASGNGRLGATSGFGRWSGKGSAGTCSGRWQATRS